MKLGSSSCPFSLTNKYCMYQGCYYRSFIRGIYGRDASLCVCFQPSGKSVHQPIRVQFGGIGSHRFMVKETAEMWSYSGNNSRSEEELGVVLGVAAMKFRLLTEQFQIRQPVKSKLEQAFSGFVEQEMEKVQASLERLRNDPYVRNKDAYAVDLDKQLTSTSSSDW